MDVVKTNIERIGGAVDVESTLGEGTTWRLTIPLTLAIIQALTVECGGERYVIPQVAVHELVYIDGQSDQDRVRLRRARSTGCAASCCRWSGSTGRSAWPRRRRPGRLRRGAAGRRPPLRPRRRPGAQHRGGRGQGAHRPVQGHRHVRRRDHPRRRQGGPDPRRRRRWPAARTWPPARRAREPGGTARGAARPAARSTGCWSPASATAGWRSRWTRSPGWRSSRVDRIERAGSREVVQYRGQILPLVRLSHLLGAYGRGAGRRHGLGGGLQRGRPQRRAGRGPDRRHRRERRRPPAATSTTTAWSARR